MQILVEDDFSQEILSDKWQCENGLCQRANAVSVVFSNTAAVHERTDLESVEKYVDFALNVNVDLRFGGDPDMVHLSPFLLILL